MAIFSRLIERLFGERSRRPTNNAHTRLVGFEPLEERRLLDVTAVPQGFTAQNVGGTEIEFDWQDTYADDVTFEIQASTTGLNSPDLWRDFFKPPGVNKFNANRDAYRSYYYRIRATEIGKTVSDWTDLADANCTANPVVECPRPTNNPEDNTVKVSAIAHSQIDVPLIAATIELRWPEELAYQDADYKVYRKEKDETSFTLKATLTWTGATITGWTDDNLGSKTAYEYKVERTRNFSPTHAFFKFGKTAIGYVYAGVDVPLEDADSTIQSPGTVILIVDNTQAAALVTELDRLQDDLFAEGWTVNRLADVAPHVDVDMTLPETDPVRVATQTNNMNAAIAIRQSIIDAPETDVKAVFLIGHVPIPMSGHNDPDGHGCRPMPADVFYGDMDNLWTDILDDDFFANPCTNSFQIFIANGIGDGIFDQQTVPDDGDGKPVELMVGRVDMRGLSDFSENETELLRRYLDKDHAFRTGQMAVERKARIRDQFARTYSSTGAWQTLSGFFGPATNPEPDEPDNIDVNKWTDTTWPLVMGLRSIASGDFTGDPNVDSSVEIVTASADDNRIAWYDRDSQGNLRMHVVSDKVRHVSSVLLADLDGDGNDDILSASLFVNASANTTFDQIFWYDHVGTTPPIFQNRGDVVAAGNLTDTGGWVPLIAAADLNGDAEFLTASQDDNGIAWHERRLGRVALRPRKTGELVVRWTTLSLAI